MTPRDFTVLFEEHYEVRIARDGKKKIYEHFSRFDQDIIEDSLETAFYQYDDAQEAFDKIGGICYNKQQQWFEEKNDGED